MEGTLLLHGKRSGDIMLRLANGLATFAHDEVISDVEEAIASEMHAAKPNGHKIAFLVQWADAFRNAERTNKKIDEGAEVVAGLALPKRQTVTTGRTNEDGQFNDKREFTDPERADLRRDQLHSIPSGQTSMSNQEIDSRGGRMGGVKSQVNEQRDRVTNRYASENEPIKRYSSEDEQTNQGFSPPQRQGIRVNREHGLGSLRTDELDQRDETAQNSSAVNKEHAEFLAQRERLQAAVSRSENPTQKTTDGRTDPYVEPQDKSSSPAAQDNLKNPGPLREESPRQ